MRLKKANAYVALVTTVLAFIHIGHQLYSYVAFDHNDFLTKLTGFLFGSFVCVHAVLGMMAVFKAKDKTRLDMYPKQNAGTVVQRMTAFLMLPLLIFHVNTFAMVTKCAAQGLFGLFIVVVTVQILFFADVFAHIAVSLPRALITVGAVTSVNSLKCTRIASAVICTLFFIASAVIITRGDIGLYSMMRAQ